MLFVVAFIAFAAWCFTGHPSPWVAGGFAAGGLACVVLVDLLEKK